MNEIFNTDDIVSCIKQSRPKTEFLDNNNVEKLIVNQNLILKNDDLNLINNELTYPSLLQLGYEYSEKFIASSIDSELSIRVVKSKVEKEKLIDKTIHDAFIKSNNKILNFKNTCTEQLKKKDDLKFIIIQSKFNEDVLGLLVLGNTLGFNKENSLLIGSIWKFKSNFDKAVLNAFKLLINDEFVKGSYMSMNAFILSDNFKSINLFQNKWGFKLRCVNIF